MCVCVCIGVKGTKCAAGGRGNKKFLENNKITGSSGNFKIDCKETSKRS